MKPLFKAFLPILAFLVVSMVAARADVLNYECGGADPGAANGVVATNSLDSAGINNLLLVGGALYSSNSPAGDTNSSLSLQFDGADYGLASAFFVTNFTAEVWVYPESDSINATIFYDGNGEYDFAPDNLGINDLDGWGFLQEGNTFAANLNGLTDLGSAPVVTNAWTHLALVCSNGVAMFLVNGQTNAVSDVAPNPPTEYLNVGGWSDGTAGFVGLIDDAKVSMSLPLTLTASWSPGQVSLYWPASYPDYCVQYVTNLDSTNWTSVSEETMPIQGELTLTNVTMDAARFYRLSPAGPPVVPVVYLHAASLLPSLITFRDTLPLADEDSGGGYGQIPCGVAPDDTSIMCDIQTLYAPSTNSFDASASVDPRSFSNASLSFHWAIFYSNAYGGQQAIAPGVNYDLPILTLPPNSMPSLQPNEYDPTAQYYIAELTIRHQPYDPNAVPSEQTIVWFRFEYVESSLGLH
ncbi:MAG TPA: LamG domain-containing protein [Verrucomicrobiae bacterium]|jgi:hypothetical protein